MKPTLPTQPATDLPDAVPPPTQASWGRVPEKPVAERVKNALLVVALALLAVSIAIAYYSANSIVSIWFEHQWAPVARLVLALLVAAVAGAAVVRMTRRKA
ncbi:MAG: hypothetical protein ACYC2H_04125 [Thermoplasmatota archaeon]